MIKRLSFTILFLFALFAMDMGSGSHHAAQPGSQRPQFVADEIIVRFRDGVDEFTKDLARFRVSGTRKKIFKIIPGLEVVKLQHGMSVEEAITLFEQIPDVLYAEPNYILHTTANPNISATPNDPSFGSLWGLTKISAPNAWNTTTGSGNVVVGILDTGFDYTHADLSANIFNNPAECVANGADNDGNGYKDDCHGIDIVNGDSDPMDDNNHGTHVAGTIGAIGNNGIGVVGVNWNVRMLSCKVFDANGSGSTDGAVDCLEYFQFMKNLGVNIVATNNSWGGGDYSQALYEAIDAQRQSGILFIAAAGNGNIFGVGQNNDTTPLYPCNYYLPNIICVAATRSTDAKAGFSNYGRRTVHVGAPGENILSTTPGNTYTSASGTSMATPHVSGLAALLKAQDPNRDWRAIKNLILTGGNTISSMANTITGKRINANGSMTCSNTVVQSRVQPIGSTISASPGVPVSLGYLNVRCASGNGNVNVVVNPGNSTLTLLDDGAGSDQSVGDGIYSAQWTPSAAGTYTLTFPSNDIVTVTVANPIINVTPSSLNFGSVYVGNSADLNLVVKNNGGGVLAGTATASAPYSITAGETYNLSPGQSQNVTVRFAPTSAGTFATNVTFTGGGDATVSVTGVGLPAAMVSVAPTSIVQGGTVTATWSGITTPTATDWIGLYPTGASDHYTSRISWQYTTGTASGSVPYPIPGTLAPGTYELRLFTNFTYTRIGKSNTFTVTVPPPPPQASLSVSPTSIVAGGTVTATWSGITTPTATDWIGLYPTGASDHYTSRISWRYTTGTASGSVPYPIPGTLAPGTYELRLFTNFTYTRIGKSNTFTVTPPQQASLSVSPSSVVAGSSVTATWSGITAPTSTDWIGLYPSGTPDHYSYRLSWQYTTGTASGNVPFTIPATAAPGTYELRLFTNFTYTRIAKSNSFVVNAP
jgi:thermitase